MRVFSFLLFTVVLAGVLAGQGTPKIKSVPVRSTSPSSGEEMFTTYCAVCHGSDGKGNGPAAPALKKRPADLTRLAATNGGKYPDLKVAQTLSAKDVVAHGSQDMPIWGKLFNTMESGDNTVVQMRITNLTSYLKSIQAK
jgi:mono/diheme cytochrome c family protein